MWIASDHPFRVTGRLDAGIGEVPGMLRFGLRSSWLRWWLVAGTLIGVAVSAGPAGAASPCDSEVVLPYGQEFLRSDCEALWTFYTGLDDVGVLDDADNAQAWGTGTPLSEWQGVGTDHTGVVWIDLAQTGLSGSLSPALGRLANLEYLNLHTNNLNGEIPAALGHLSKLTLLELGGNQFSGRLPAQLGNLADLEYFVLHSSDVTGPIPKELGNLKKLRDLHLYGNKLRGEIPKELAGMEELRVLNLAGNALTGPIPEELGQLANLTKLYLGNNKLQGRIPDSLANLKNLVELELDGNELSGRIPTRLAIQLANAANRTREQPADDDLTKIYSADPLGLIAHADVFREHSLGPELWEVWTCDIPKGDLPLKPDEIIRSLKREITRYFEWLSNDRYRPDFEYIRHVEADDRAGCESAARATPTSNRLLVIDDSADTGGYYSGAAVVVGGGSVATAPGWSEPVLATVSHEIGHAMGFPHSFGGKIRWRNGTVYEGDNPMDLVSGQVRIDLNTATIAVNRYAAGWIDPDNVAIHQVGTTEVYELRPPGLRGLQMVVIPGTTQGVFHTLGARIGVGWDLAIPRQGVEVYRIDQRPSACSYPSSGACWGTNRRTQPDPPAEPGVGYGDDLYGERKARLTQHVHGAGESFEIGPVTVEVVERIGNYFMVRVVDPRTPDPSEDTSPPFQGRFADDDGSVHEADIEVIAELGITAGCGTPEEATFCPERPVARAQMMVFLARALGEDGRAAPTTSRFSDVPGNAWYLSSLERMADLGVVEPFEDGTFRPDEPVTRLDMAVFMTRAFSHIESVESPSGVFADVAAEADHAGEVEGIYAAKVTAGCKVDPLRYCPDQPVRRDQMASFLVRALQPASTRS